VFLILLIIGISTVSKEGTISIDSSLLSSSLALKIDLGENKKNPKG
jgi:flagellar capping protein FliD